MSICAPLTRKIALSGEDFLTCDWTQGKRLEAEHARDPALKQRNSLPQNVDWGRISNRRGRMAELPYSIVDKAGPGNSTKIISC